jgi:hypothetical protein
MSNQVKSFGFIRRMRSAIGIKTPTPLSTKKTVVAVDGPRPLHLDVFPELTRKGFREAMTEGLTALGCTDESFLAMINNGKLSMPARKAFRKIAANHEAILQKSYPISHELNEANGELRKAKELRKVLSRYPKSAQNQADREINEVKKEIARITKDAKKIDREYQVVYRQRNSIRFIFDYFELCEYEALSSGKLWIPQFMYTYYHIGCSHSASDSWSEDYYPFWYLSKTSPRKPLIEIR